MEVIGSYQIGDFVVVVVLQFIVYGLLLRNKQSFLFLLITSNQNRKMNIQIDNIIMFLLAAALLTTMKCFILTITTISNIFERHQ